MLRTVGIGNFRPRIWVPVALQGTYILFHMVVARFGIPHIIVSDRDSKFTGRFWTELFRLAGTRLAM